MSGLERWVAVQFFAALAGVVAEEWNVLPSPPPATAPSAPSTIEWNVLDSPEEWLVLAGEPAKARGDSCLCVMCDCKPPCECCKEYAEVERQALKTGRSVLLAVGVRREEAQSAQREAKARGLLFCHAVRLSGIGDDGKREDFPNGVWELVPRPKEGRLYFLPQPERKIPIPDKPPAKASSKMKLDFSLAPAR